MLIALPLSLVLAQIGLGLLITPKHFGSRERIFLASALGLALVYLLGLSGLPTGVWTVGFLILGGIGWALEIRRILLRVVKWSLTDILVSVLTLCFLIFWVMSEPIGNFAFDTRSTWFFKGKIIYFNGAFNREADWYNPAINFWSHLDYPKLGAFLIAASAWLSGGWTESLTKANLVCLNFACFIGVLSLVRASIASLLWGYSLIVMVGGYFLQMGYMDGQLAIAAGVACVFGAKFVADRSIESALCFWASLCLAQMFKNEGSLLLMAAAGATFGALGLKGLVDFLKRLWADKRHLLLFLVLFAPLVVWGAYKKAFGFNYVLGLKSPGRVWTRLQNEPVFEMIWKFLFEVPSLWGVLLLGISAFALFSRKSRAVGFMLGFGTLYLSGMIFVYVITPHPLEWHLASSADRTALGIMALFLSAAFWALTPERDWKGLSKQAGHRV